MLFPLSNCTSKCTLLYSIPVDPRRLGMPSPQKARSASTANQTFLSLSGAQTIPRTGIILIRQARSRPYLRTRKEDEFDRQPTGHTATLHCWMSFLTG